MLKRKLLLVNCGHGERGKSASLNLLIDYLSKSRSEDYDVVEINTKSGDHWAVFNYQGVKIGIESQGDPRSRMPRMMDRFMSDEFACEIIITASRTKRAKVAKGKELIDDPFRKVLDMQKNYTLIWAPNARTQKKEDDCTQTMLRELWVHYIVQLVENWVEDYV